MIEQIRLTPAQVEFIRKTLPEFEDTDTFGELAGRAASSRYFTRIRHDLKTYILVEWDSRDEDWPRFLDLAADRDATASLLPVVFASDARHGLILEEDLGVVTLKKYCSMVNFQEEYLGEIYRQVIDALHHWQRPELAKHRIISAREMDSETFLWESWYFSKYCVTDYCGCETLLDEGWERERLELANECAALAQCAIHRDFQSENVMLHDGAIRFVDFQGARLGPPHYDIASLLYDPYVSVLTPKFVGDLYDHYCDTAGDEVCSLRSLQLCAVQRLMQALGAYGNLTLHKGKEWYQEFIPVALERLCHVLEQIDGFDQLSMVAQKCRKVVYGMNEMAVNTSSKSAAHPDE